MKNRSLNLILIFIIAVFFNSCIDPFDIKTITFKSALVVEATITNEFKFQEIKLSRTYDLEEEGQSNESNANVKVVDNFQNIYSFYETTSGKYVSAEAFSALNGRDYQLKIETSDGKLYSSKLTQLTNTSQIDKVYAEKSEDGDGIIIFVDSSNPNGNARYYRFGYEETYKIIASKWSDRDLVIISKDPPVLDFAQRNKNKKVCYATINSIGIIQTETNNLVDDRITKFPVRYISKDNYIISHRYSMLLKQYVQSQEAYTFYKTLNDLSGSESLFSQNQPGFINGNIYSEDNSNESVIGFFEVSSVSTKRYFFSPQDLDLTVPYPRPYPVPCHITAPQLNPRFGNSLIDYLESGNYLLYARNGPGSPPVNPPTGGPFIITESACGDCTEIGTNIKPDFWVE
jgi:hypothetical protein